MIPGAGVADPVLEASAWLVASGADPDTDVSDPFVAPVVASVVVAASACVGCAGDDLFAPADPHALSIISATISPAVDLATRRFGFVMWASVTSDPSEVAAFRKCWPAIPGRSGR